MNGSDFYIPKKIKVGYQNRKDTYSGKLSYVIYQDDKGQWRKNKSFEGWIDKKIDVDIFDNTPKSGFVLNKKVGGVSYGWNNRREYIRVYDPRGFEFEITVPNLLFILQEANSLKGKGLEGEFVYSWYGKDLVLLPVSANEYKSSIIFSQNQSKKVYVKDLKAGFVYMLKNGEKSLYIGKTFHYRKRTYKDKIELGEIISTKGHVFYNLKSKTFSVFKNMNKLSYEAYKYDVDGFAELYDEYKNSKHGNKPSEFSLVKIDTNDLIKEEAYGDFFIKQKDIFVHYHLCVYDDLNHVSAYSYNKNVIFSEENVFLSKLPDRLMSNKITLRYIHDLKKYEFYYIEVTTENGKKYKL